MSVGESTVDPIILASPVVSSVAANSGGGSDEEEQADVAEHQAPKRQKLSRNGQSSLHPSVERTTIKCERGVLCRFLLHVELTVCLRISAEWW